MKGIVLIGVFCGLAISASSWALAETKSGHSPEPGIPTGHLLYEQHCLRCHGVALDGKGPDAASLKVPPANFHLYLSRLKDDTALKKTIKEGRRFLGMHNWEDTFNDEQVRDLILYIRSAAPEVKVKP
jgi:mono/diheme cytochrome c family protein